MQVDPVDIQIQCASKSIDLLAGKQFTTHLSPEESVFEVLDRTFVNGQMTINDAFLITISKSIPFHQSQGSQLNLVEGSPKSYDEQGTLESPVLGGSFLTNPTGEHTKGGSTGSFFKTITSHRPTVSDTATTSQSSGDSLNGLDQLRKHTESPRESSTSPIVASRPAPFPVTSGQTPFTFPPVASLNQTAPSNTGNPAVVTTSNMSIDNGGAQEPNSSSASINRRNSSQIPHKAGNGVILLPKQFKASNMSNGGRKGGQSRPSNPSNPPTQSNSTLHVNNFVGSESSVDTSARSSPASSVVGANRIQTPHSASREELHAKPAPYQRKKSYNSAGSLDSNLDITKIPKKKDDAAAAAAAAASAATSAHSEGEDNFARQTPPAKREEASKEKRVASGAKTGARSTLPSSNKANVQASPAKQSREANNHRLITALQKSNLAGDGTNNTQSITNNRKLLLSINKGISPYTTVVPQINVLIVEDNVINQKILEKFLRKRKIRSATAKNGKEAIEKWGKGGFHLVLMDIQLPVMSGIEATKKIRQLEHQNRIGVFSNRFSSEEEETKEASDGTKDTFATTDLETKPEEVLDTKKFRSPVIIVALTASSSLADKSEALAAGCNDFLTKPVNLKWLEQKTIEWGCMQALIDFEGWKHWVSKETPSSTPINTTPTLPSTSTMGGKPPAPNRQRSYRYQVGKAQ